MSSRRANRGAPAELLLNESVRRDVVILAEEEEHRGADRGVAEVVSPHAVVEVTADSEVVSAGRTAVVLHDTREADAETQGREISRQALVHERSAHRSWAG